MMVITFLLPLFMMMMVVVITTSAVDVSTALNLTLKQDNTPDNVKQCMEKVADKNSECREVFMANHRTHHLCELEFYIFYCYADTICRRCDHDDAIATEAWKRKDLVELIKTEGNCPHFKPPKSLEQPFCTPASSTDAPSPGKSSAGLPVWAIVIIVLVALACCCGLIGIAVFSYYFGGDAGHPNRSGSGHSGKGGGGAHHSGKRGSKTGKRHSSKGRRSSSHQSHR